LLVIVLGDATLQRYMLKSKIHRATLTGTELSYEGSISIDLNLIEAANLLPGEQVHVLNLSNNERLVTYVIEAPRGSGTMELNGPAARAGLAGDLLVVISYCTLDDADAAGFESIVVKVDENNRQIPSS